MTEKIINYGYDGHAESTNDCGDSVEIFISMKDGTVDDVKSEIHACHNVMSCVLAAENLVKGQTAKDALINLSVNNIIKNVKNLPKEEKHCAEMVSTLMTDAIIQSVFNSGQPWQRMYRTF